jgi:hypothetical protein
MRDAMFGATKTPTALFHELCSLRQEGKLSDPDAFLREKERLLKRLPVGSLAGWAQASAVMMGMNPLIIAAISPNPHSQDGQYHSYEELRKAVVATVGLNQLLLPNTPVSADKAGWQQQGNHKGPNSPRFAPYQKSNTPNKHQSQGKAQATKAGDGAGPSTSKPVIGKWVKSICADCGHAGHQTKGYKDCPKHVPVTQFLQKDDKGKAKA